MKNSTVPITIATCLLLTPTLVSGRTVKRKPTKRTLRRVSVSPSALLDKALAKRKLSPKYRAKQSKSFKKLPKKAQDTVLSALSPIYAKKLNMPILAKKFKIIDKVQLFLKPTISFFYPYKGSPGKYSLIKGIGCGQNCKVYFNGNACNTVYGMGFLCFQIPAGTAVGQDYNVYVRNTKSKVNGPTTKYRIVTPMGYRGQWGWKFANWGTPTYGWNLYRSVFGANAVEFANGTHRPAAQTWFNDVWRSVGAGGNCFGMSVRSIRTRRYDWKGLHSNWWPSNKEFKVWEYERDPQIVDSVHEDQGQQISAQTWGRIVDRWNNQTHVQALNLIKAGIASGSSAKLPILMGWRLDAAGNGVSGHAVVAYKVVENGNIATIYLYDNNAPYRETTNSDENSKCTVNKATGAFAWGTRTRMVALRFNEVTPAQPLLPTEAGGPAGAGSTVIVCSSPRAIKQIVDERGRKFFTGKKSAIPNSMLFRPLGGKVLPKSFPAIFIFNKSKGKNLKVLFNSGRNCKISAFTRGRIFSLNGKGGEVKFSALAKPEASLTIINPDSMRLASAKIIAIQKDKTERSFELTPTKTLQKGSLKLQLSPGNKGIKIDNKLKAPAGLKLHIKRFSRRGVLNSRLKTLSVPKGRLGKVEVSNFKTLKTAPLNLKLKK